MYIYNTLNECTVTEAIWHDRFFQVFTSVKTSGKHETAGVRGRMLFQVGIIKQKELFLVSMPPHLSYVHAPATMYCHALLQTQLSSPDGAFPNMCASYVTG